jgi:hypothetical protein
MSILRQCLKRRKMEQKVFNTKEQHTLNLQERTISLFTRKNKIEFVGQLSRKETENAKLY